ncbi:MAG: hotdog fold thioesterase [bacterium]|nr:hotdog fold thioesterase [bacterium]
MSIPPFNEFLGTRLVHRGDGEAEVQLELQPHHLNRRGVAHGGVIASLLDSALGMAVISSMPAEWWCATTSLTTNFVDGPRGGRLVGTGRVVRRGSSIAFAEGEVRDERGRVVATASGSWRLWPRRPGSRPEARGSHLLRTDSGERIRPGKILAVGRNYADHVKEMGNAADAPPVMFLKPTTALVPGGGRIELPADAGEVHHEVELVVVIGKAGREIAADEALDHVLGYAVGLDLTAREVQAQAKSRGEPWTLAKGFDGSAPVSAVAAREAVGDGSALDIRLTVNGETRQQGNTSSMSRSVAELIEHASRWITLEPGDLLFTGTPAGVGPLHSGDRARAEIDRVGLLEIEIA